MSTVRRRRHTHNTTAESSAEDTLGAENPTDTSVCETNGHRIAPEVARRLGCDASLVALIEDSEGNPIAVGDKTRAVSKKLRRALEHRDGHTCRSHGCGSTRRLHAHHIIHWAEGGPTTLDNLILLCEFHHHTVHEGGWSIHTRPDGGHDFINPDGITVGIEVFRGRLHPLAQAESPHIIGKNPGERVEDLSWITSILIQNRDSRQRQHQHEPQTA